MAMQRCIDHRSAGARHGPPIAEGGSLKTEPDGKGIVVGGTRNDVVNNLLSTRLPERLSGVGTSRSSYGDPSSVFIICDAVLKVKRKGGQPVVIKVGGPGQRAVAKQRLKSFAEDATTIVIRCIRVAL